MQVSQNPDPEELIVRLSFQLQSQNCVLFAGSGLSAQAGFPTWRTFARMLVERFSSSAEKSLAEEMIDSGDTDAVVYDIARDHRADLALYVKEIFKTLRPLPETHALIERMGFQAAITSNWDNLLEETYPAAAVLLSSQAEVLQSYLLKKQFFLLKVYGDPDHPDSLVLDASDFDRQMSVNSQFMSFIHSLLLQQTFVFVGCSLDGIENFLRSVRFFQTSSPHFAIVGVRGNSWQPKARLFADRYGLLTVPYQESQDHKGLVELLRRLSIKSEDRPAGKSPPRAGTQTLKGHGGPVWSLSITPNENQLVSASDDDNLRIWSLYSGETLQVLGNAGSDIVYSIAVTPNGKETITASRDHVIRVWDLPGGCILRILTGHSGPVYSVAVTPDGSSVVSGSGDETIRVWDLDTGAIRMTIATYATVYAIAVTPDGKKVVAGLHDATVKIWDIRTGALIQTLQGHSKPVYCIAITPDGRYAVSGSVDSTLNVWNLSNGTLHRTLDGHTEEVRCVAITPDGSRIISGGGDRAIRLSDLSTGKLLQTLQGHSDAILCLAITLDGVHAISGARDKTLRVWDLQRTTSRLRRAVLENIGPFDRLELNFEADWTIFLGNNGTGKSTVLKALAIALCGADAAPWADRVIRVGVQQAVITLQTETDSYRTVLRRRLASHGADIEAIPIRPMDGEGWLVLGFPALRTGTARSQSPESDGSTLPAGDDVLPLIQGEVDPRLDRLKQWIINLDYRTKDAKSRGAKDEPFTRLINEFFDVVGSLTEGLPMRFGGVDPNTRQITLVTVDGLIPIEQLSQGALSLLSWVGIILQRLYEVFGSNNSRHQYAIILLDEIDAHMHPSWQQILVPRLKELFPAIQFIVTSHSPLIVAGRLQDELLVFERGRMKPTITVSRPAMDSSGMRADQILTSPAFGLLGARDEATVRKQGRYGELLNRAVLTPGEEVELSRLRVDPAIVARPVEETPRLEAVAELARKMVARHLWGDQRADPQKLAIEIERYLTNALLSPEDDTPAV